jgi:hypothetical protein
MWQQIDSLNWEWKQYVPVTVSELWIENIDVEWNITNIHSADDPQPTSWQINENRNGVRAVSSSCHVSYPHITSISPWGGAPGEAITITGDNFVQNEAFSSIEILNPQGELVTIIACHSEGTNCDNESITTTLPQTLQYGHWYQLVVNRGGLKSLPYGYGLAVGPRAILKNESIEAHFSVMDPTFSNLFFNMYSVGDRQAIWTAELHLATLPQCAAVSYSSASVINPGSFQIMAVGVDTSCLNPGVYSATWRVKVGDGQQIIQEEDLEIKVFITGHQLFLPFVGK